jgi:hypothetical protein
MSKIESKNENKEQCAWEAYQKIKKALDGLYEILNLNFEEQDMFYQCGLDNLEKLKDVIVDILEHDYDSKEVQYKMRELEFDFKKCLFFEEDKKKES